MITTSPHQTAKPLEAPLFACSWERAVFLHYRVQPRFLQPQIPFELDLYDGAAYVSLVAFTLCNMRLNHPRLKFVTHPLHTHAFLNVRTYVRVDRLRGIYFLAEWLNNRLATILGPILYGLPYRFGTLQYAHEEPNLSGRVLGAGARPGLLRYSATIPLSRLYKPAVEETLDYFLLERYLAFTRYGPSRRLFRVWHEPWRQQAIEAYVKSDSLLNSTGRWFTQAQLVGANFSPGLNAVQMGWPEKI